VECNGKKPLDCHRNDQTTISRTRRLIDVEADELVFAWILSVLDEHGLLRA
jgi:hypothetical protein